MSFKFDEKSTFTPSFQISLKNETLEITTEISEILGELSNTPDKDNILVVQRKFAEMVETWTSLDMTLNESIQINKESAKVVQEKSFRIKDRSEMHLKNKQISVDEKVKQSVKKERRAKKSLTRIKKIWQDDLLEFEKNIQNQKRISNSVKNDLLTISKSLEDSILTSDLDTFIQRQTKLCKSEKSERTAAETTKSNFEQSIIVSNHSSNPSSDSYEFEKCMAELDKLRSISIENPLRFSFEKSFGGWKSEYESDSESIISPISQEEIKSAINILSKANLLTPESINILGQLSDAIIDSDETNNLDLFYQLISLHNSAPEDFQILKKKPSTLRNQSTSSQDLASTTPKSKLIFTEICELNKTVLSNHNRMSNLSVDGLESISHELETQFYL
ncbi:hypothetical protein SteCoe_6818 [Stentor coeruleus]|uniref:Uncharacterized protein n=1 Tax=Stentor coeruleus TaxID=5963 RepID=A0A1R2CP11_9CILI|nr:hypothetical protein SteCoe_6818 [Stentor coeruleus]